MQTMQTRIIGFLEDLITEVGLEPVQKGSYANTGHIYAMDGLHAVVDVTYDFQDGYCSLFFDGPAVSLANLTDNAAPRYRVMGDSLRYYNLKYTDGARMEGLLKQLRGILREAMAVRPKTTRGKVRA